MAKRGRASAADLQVLPSAQIETVERPDAPYDLTEEQSAEWWAVGNRVPAEWFPRETHGLLAQYCRHVVTARRVAEMIEAAQADKETSLDDLDKLYKMQEREGRALSSLATRMRISQQATFDKERKKPKQAANKLLNGFKS